MKRILITSLMLLCALLLPRHAAAQTHYSSRVSLGAKAGADMSMVFFSPSVRQQLAPGANAGFMFRYVEESHFGLIAEINFSQRGWKEDFQGLDFRYQRTLNYVDIPVMAHIYFGRRGKFFINLGPQINFFLGESESANFDVADMQNISGFPNTNRTNTQMTMAVTNKIDFGICGGLGGEFSINPRNSLMLECRVYYGLGNIFSAKRTDVFRASNQLSVAASLGYWFRIK